MEDRSADDREGHRTAAECAVSESTKQKLSSEDVAKFMERAATFVKAPMFAVMIKMLEDKCKTSDKAGAAEATSVIREIKAVIGRDGSNVLRIEGADLHPAVHGVIGKGAALDIWLGFGPLDYESNIMVPDEVFGKVVFSQYQFLMRSAQAYWNTFKLQYASLYKRIHAIFGDCVGTLKVSGHHDEPDKPAADKPAADADKPAADKPAADKPAVDKPAADNPVKEKEPVVPNSPKVDQSGTSLYWDRNYHTRIVVIAAYRNSHGYIPKKTKK